MAKAATNIYTANYQAGKVSADWEALSSANRNLTIGYAYSGNNWVTAIRFTLESACSSITLALCPGADVTGLNKVTYNYKITSAEDSSLTNATHTTSGDGSFTADVYGYVPFTVTIEKMLTAGTYYIYLWTGISSDGNWCRFRTVYSGEDYTLGIEYEELSISIHIDGGTSIEAYMLYIDSGSSLDKYIPCIDNGSAWEPFS